MKRNNKKLDPKDPRYMTKEQEQIVNLILSNNELEKVDTEIVKAKADIEVQNYAMAIENLERCTFILEHIKEKNSLKIVNVF